MAIRFLPRLSSFRKPHESVARSESAEGVGCLLKIGWRVKREAGGSHKVLEREGFDDYVFAFHDYDEIGSKMLTRIAKQTGLTVADL